MFYAVPGKAFLFGEYSILNQSSAGVFTFGPAFELSNQNGAPLSGLHPNSPARKLLDRYEVRVEDENYFFKSHLKDGKGCGTSTAEYLMAAHIIAEKKNLKIPFAELFKLYRSFHTTQPSGADLKAQAVGGVLLLQEKGSSKSLKNWPFQNLKLHLFKRPHKLVTHSHLDELNLSALKASSLAILAHLCRISFETGDEEGFLKNIKLFTEELVQRQLQSAEVLAECSELNALIQGRGYARGSGAMGYDLICVFILNSNFRELKSWADKYGLFEIATDRDIWKNEIYSVDAI